jgi:heterodisulfide reductase subunit A
MKNALRIKNDYPDTDIHILYRDIMTYGLAEQYYIEAKGKGIDFVRYEPEKKPVVTVTDEGKLQVAMLEPVLKETIILKPDLVVLSLGPSPPKNCDLFNIFETSLNTNIDGFVAETNVKFRPVDTACEGIYLCGLAHSPRTIRESMIQAQAAAGRALSILTKDRISARRVVSEVNERWCTGCEMCITACPYDARLMDAEKGTATIDAVLCRGCGVCAVMCPSGATKLRCFTEKQMMAIIEEAVG